jgi:hypothetical protein
MALVAFPPCLAVLVEKLATQAPAGLPASRSIGEGWCDLDWLPGHALRAQKSTLLIDAYQAAVAGNIGCEDGG